MNYSGANGLEFGAGNANIDPAVLRGKQQALGKLARSSSY
jgi:hypothetical protein